MLRERLDEPCQVGGQQEVGRTAAEVELADLTMVIEEWRDHRDLPEQPLHVAAARRHVTRDQPVAAAVKARTGTERNVNVERQRPGRERRVAPPRMLAILRL